MKSTAPVAVNFYQAFDADQVADVLKRLEAFDEGKWFHRKKINSRPTQGVVEADYFFCGDRQQPKDFNEFIRSLAPKIPGTLLGEACVNRYLVGGGMPEHIDIAMYRYNVVVTLNALGDGVEINGVFYPDVAGQAVQFPAKSPPHRVPAVKNKRYVIIYLYE